jgi:hypothetical protein
MLALRVPAERWWLVVGAAAVGVVGSIAADGVDRRAASGGG